MDDDRYLVMVESSRAEQVENFLGVEQLLGRPVAAEEWQLMEIRAGRPRIVQATQDQFVPQMVNLDALGGVDFKKGCYPGQEIVARTQYRGQLKRRMVRARIAASSGASSLAAGQELFCDALPGQSGGTVVNAARAADGTELLAVVPLEAIENRIPVRVAPAGAALELLDAPRVPCDVPRAS